MEEVNQLLNLHFKLLEEAAVLDPVEEVEEILEQILRLETTMMIYYFHLLKELFMETANNNNQIRD